MHKGIILLVEASDKGEAINKADGFIEDTANRGDDNIDWGEVGGRWSDEIEGDAKPYNEVKDLVAEWEGAQAKNLEGLKESFRESCKREDIETITDLAETEHSYSLWLAGKLYKLKSKMFSTEISVFDLNEYHAGTEYLEDTDNIWAVMIDLHS